MNNYKKNRLRKKKKIKKIKKIIKILKTLQKGNLLFQSTKKNLKKKIKS